MDKLTDLERKMEEIREGDMFRNAKNCFAHHNDVINSHFKDLPVKSTQAVEALRALPAMRCNGKCALVVNTIDVWFSWLASSSCRSRWYVNFKGIYHAMYFTNIPCVFHI